MGDWVIWEFRDFWERKLLLFLFLLRLVRLLEGFELVMLEVDGVRLVLLD